MCFICPAMDTQHRARLFLPSLYTCRLSLTRTQYLEKLKQRTLDSFCSSRHVPYLLAPGPDAAAAAAVFFGEAGSPLPFSIEGKRFLGDDLVGDCNEGLFRIIQF